MKRSTVFQSQLQDKEIFGKLRGSGGLEAALETARSDLGLETAEAAAGVSPSDLELAIENLAAGETDLFNANMAEAIIMVTGYPSLLIRDGDYEEPKEDVWRRRLNPHRAGIKKVIKSVCRVEFKRHPRREVWNGTSWLIDDDVLITNQHVARKFIELRDGKMELTRAFEVWVDFAEEIGSKESLERLVKSIVYVEPFSSDVDLALMRLEKGTSASLGLQPIALKTQLSSVEYLGVVGYPADDRRNNPYDAFHAIFEGKFGVKRFAPGKVMDDAHSANIFTHNCTTLGGNSGSVVFDVATGSAIGLHCGGSALEQNYAVKAAAVADRLRKNHVTVHSAGANFKTRAAAGGGDGDEASEAASSFEDRDGYQPDFLGAGHLSVPLPILSPRQAAKAARTEDGKVVLNYRHYSSIVNKSRRLAYFSAVNIDGLDRRNPRRKGFRFDPRLPDDVQIGAKFYEGNVFDKGHLVRRVDPCWGSKEEAEQANADSSYYTNIAPQHTQLNQKIWNELEDHILSVTVDERARVSVFVGCLFSEDDPVHEPTGIKVPMAFWKVVVSLGTTARRGYRQRAAQLQAQAFIMSQQHLVKPDDLEIVFGEGFETYQVTLAQLSRMTGHDFHKLVDADTFALSRDEEEAIAASNINESAGGILASGHFKPITSFGDIEM